MGKTYFKKLEEQAKDGVEIHLITPKKWGNQNLEISSKENLTIYSLPIFFSGKNHFYFFKSYLKKFIIKISPHLLHINEEPWSLVTFQCLMANKELKIPVIGFTWQNILKKYPFPFSYFEKVTYKKAKGIIAGNKEAKEVLRKKGYKGLIEVIPEVGVDENIFKPMDVSDLKDSLGLSDKIVIGYFGRLVKEKGIYLLLEAVKILRKRIKNLILLIVGDGPEKERIKNYIQSFGMEKDTILLDRVETGKVPMYMNLLDVLVLPSFEYRGKLGKGWKEQFGRVLIEAMACEVPVVGSSSGEIPNVIGDAGLIFKERSVEDLVEKLTVLIVNPKLRKILGKKGRERVINTYTQKIVARQTNDFYRKVIEKCKQ